MAASDAKKIIKWQGSLTIEKADALKQEFLQAFDSANYNQNKKGNTKIQGDVW